MYARCPEPFLLLAPRAAFAYVHASGAMREEEMKWVRNSCEARDAAEGGQGRVLRVVDAFAGEPEAPACNRHAFSTAQNAM